MDKLNTEDLIWKKLDGIYTNEEEALFCHLISTDPSFKNEFDQAKKVHTVLTNLPLTRAPEGLIEETIQLLKPASGYQYRPTPLVIFLVGISLLSISTIFFPPVESGIPYLAPWLNAVHLPISFDWAILSNFGSYAAILLVIPLFALIDHLISNKIKAHHFVIDR